MEIQKNVPREEIQHDPMICLAYTKLFFDEVTTITIR